MLNMSDIDHFVSVNVIYISIIPHKKTRETLEA